MYIVQWCIGKRKYHALMLSSTHIYEVKSLCQQLRAGFQTKEISLIGAWAVSSALSLYFKRSLENCTLDPEVSSCVL